MGKQQKPASKCAVASQVVIAGAQDVAVRSFGRDQGWMTPYVSVKVGRVVFNIEDRDALLSLTEAVRQARQLADETFGPAWAPRRR